MRAARPLALVLAALLVAALVATAASSVSLRAVTGQLRALQMAAGVLCAPGGSGAPGHPAGHGHLGDCCCPAGGHPDILFPPTLTAQPADAAAVARIETGVAAAPGHPAGWRFIEARGPPAHA